MNSVLNQSRTQSPPASARLRNGFKASFGRSGIAWAAAFTAAATLLRWVTDGWLADCAPFSFYYLSVVLTALMARTGSAILAVILGSLCGHYLWVTPRLSLEFTNTSQVAQLVVFVVVGCLCALAVSVARIFRLFEEIDKSED